MPESTKRMRAVARDRTGKAISRYEAKLGKEANQKRLETDRKEMQKILLFFFENCPREIPEELKKVLENTMVRQGSRNKIGMINFIADEAGAIWPEWKTIAYEQFIGGKNEN